MQDTSAMLRRPLDVSAFMPETTQLEELAGTTEALISTREVTHGPFILTAKIAQDLKEAYRYGPADLKAEQREALDHICTKIARIMSGDPNTTDHWDDIAGYAKLGSNGCGQ